jgi:hypothetical protein
MLVTLLAAGLPVGANAATGQQTAPPPATTQPTTSSRNPPAGMQQMPPAASRNQPARTASHNPPMQSPSPGTHALPPGADPNAAGAPPAPQSGAGQPTSRNQPMQTPSPGSQITPETSSTAGAQKTKTNAPKQTALTVHDVRVPGNINIEGQRLALNGAATHSTWFFFHKYVAGLYLAKKTHSAPVAISEQVTKAIWLSMLTDASKQDFTDSLHSAFQANLPENGSNSQLEQKWQHFASFFTDLEARDKVIIAYVPGQGISVKIKGNTHGPIPGDSFARTIFAMWLGSHPIDSGVKSRMLGKRT